MTSDIIDEAIIKAEEVLDENIVTEPPVKITEIARNYGLLVETADLGVYGAEVAGFIDPKAKIIYVNKKDSPTRQAFTIAHELGHWLMHKDKLEKEPNKYAILYRRPLGTINGDPVEKQANTFAANLLVPKKMLKKYKNVDVNTLADIFGVSTEVIGYRLKDESRK